MRRVCACLLIVLLAVPLLAEDRVTQSTAVRLPVGPFLSPSDGVTPVTGLTAASISVVWFQPAQYSTITNQVTNGTFTGNATSWTLGSGWAYSSNTIAATTSSAVASQQITCIQNVAYRVVFTATRSAGSVTVSLGGTAGTSRSTASTFTETIICGSTGLVEFTGSGFTGTIDDVTVEQWPMTLTLAASGSANDFVHRVGGIYELELTAAQMAITGTHRLYFYDSGSYVPVPMTVEVDAAAGLACSVAGNCSTVAGIWAAATSGLTTSSSIGKLLVDNVNAALSTIVSAISAAQSDITRQYVMKGAEDKEIPVGPFRSSLTHLSVVTTGTPSCTKRSNSSTTYSATTNSASTVDGQGFSALTIAAAESSGKTFLVVKCTLTNADDAYIPVLIQ